MWEMLLVVLLVSFLLSVFFTPITILLAKKLRLVDDPQKHKHPAILHKKTIPRAGGLPIFLSLVICTLIFLPANTLMYSILIAGVFVVAIGLLDDRLDLSPYLRFFINIICASFVVFQGVTLPFITHPLGGIFSFNIMLPFIPISLSQILAIVWIAWVMNMLNWSKGIDGQMPGIAAISAIVIGIASLRFSLVEPMNVMAAEMSFILAGAALGFLVFNFYPAKIFPGYSATILGFTLGVLSLISGVKLATALLVMGIPATDFLFTFTRRILSKRSPFWHDKGHLHHLLLNIGWGQRSIAIFYWVMSLLLGVIALSLSSKGKVFAIIVVLVVVTGFILLLRYLTRNDE